MCQSGLKSTYKLGVIFNFTFKVVVQIYSRFAATTCSGLVSLFPEMERNAELWLLSTMYQTGPGTLWRMTFCQPGWGCSELIMEPQTVGLINCEGSTRSMCKSVCHAGAVSREQLGQSSWNSWHPAPPWPLNWKQPGSHHEGLREMNGMLLSSWIFLYCPLKLSSSFFLFFLIIHSDLGRFTWKRLNPNTTTCIKEYITSLYNICRPQRSALVVSIPLIMPVLLVWDSEEDDLTPLILAPHQKHIGEGTKCCYYQKQTFEIKLHLYLIHSLTPCSKALPESLKHLVRESFVTAWNNFSLE